MKQHDPGGRKPKWYKPWRYIPHLRRKTPKTPQFQSPITDYTPTQIPTDVPPNVPIPIREGYVWRHISGYLSRRVVSDWGLKLRSLRSLTPKMWDISPRLIPLWFTATWVMLLHDLRVCGTCNCL